MIAPDDFGDPGFGVYIHWPFCLAKCPYCDFNSHVRHTPVDGDTYAKALARELTEQRRRTGPRTVESIFFGGGTPSLMTPKQVATVLDAVADNWQVSHETEITLEANPTSAEADNFRGYRLAGVNRLSVGIQALDDRALKALGRQHTATEALSAFADARRLFARTSFDLIYARPDQSLESWRKELSMALGEQNGHMSLYQLTIEPGTPFEQLHAAGKLIPPPDDDALALYALTQELTEQHGLCPYEISNHARPGHHSRHNLLYWRYGEYAGVGPGAHARLQTGQNRMVLQNEKSPENWLSMVNDTGSGCLQTETLDHENQTIEFFMMGLRLASGVRLSDARSRFGYESNHEKVRQLVEDGFLEQPGNGDIIRATRKGRFVLNSVIAELTAQIDTRAP